MDNIPVEQLIERRRDELLSYINSFYRSSWDWRSSRFHQQWDKYDRNYHSIYNPDLASKKEPWQMQMFIGVTIQNVELITSEIFKTMMAPKPPIRFEAGPAGDPLQAQLIQEAIDYQLRKASFDVNFYDTLKEAVRYGSGFMKMFWDREIDTRTRRVPIDESPAEIVSRMTPEEMTGQAPVPEPRLKGYEFRDVPVLLKNQLGAKYVHIRDVFPEPNTTTWDKLIHRDRVTYGEIVRGILANQFYDCRDKLENLTEGEKFDQDTRTIKQDRGYFEINRSLAKFEKKHTLWEFWGKIPRKWIQYDMPDGDEAETLVPARVLVASGVAVLASEENKKFDGQVPVLKLDYIRTGETYGKGVPELIQDEQDEINELRNLRVDNVNLIMNKMIGVIEAALVNANDLVSKPGGVIRIKANVSDDIRKAIFPIEFNNVTQNAYQETMEIERGIQERTGANRVTLGSSGLVKDTNQTLGGMELLKQMFNERIAAYGMVMESQFLIKAAEKIYGLIYQELQPEDMKYILGDDPVIIQDSPVPGMPPVTVPRYMAFVFMPPEILNKSYIVKPMGIFSLENRTVKAAQAMDLAKLFAPVTDMTKAAKDISKIMQLNEAEDWFIPMPMLPPLMPPQDKKETPGMKGGPNGNQPSFLPPNPVRREPVT